MVHVRDYRHSQALRQNETLLRQGCVCVCVYHLYRCKTSLYVSARHVCFFTQWYAGGTWSMDRSGANEDTYPMLVISRLITVTYLPIFQKWEEAQPKNLHVVHLNFFGFLHQNLPLNVFEQFLYMIADTIVADMVG